MRVVLFVLGFLLAATTALAADKAVVCKNSPKIVARCFTVHGRLSIFEGGWNLRIWPIGSHRLLAVVDGAHYFYDDQMVVVPKSIEVPLEKFGLGTQIFANYRVCPLTSAKPKAMQHVCILGVSHVFVQRPESH